MVGGGRLKYDKRSKLVGANKLCASFCFGGGGGGGGGGGCGLCYLAAQLPLALQIEVCACVHGKRLVRTRDMASLSLERDYSAFWREARVSMLMAVFGSTTCNDV